MIYYKSKNHRKLNPKELEDGMYVQCGSSTTDGDVEFSDIVYRLIKVDDQFFYTLDDVEWKMDSKLVIDNWYETDKTREYNRDKKISDILS